MHEEEDSSQLQVDDQRERIEFLGAPDLGHGFIQPAHRRQMHGIHKVSRLVTRVQLDGPLVFTFGISPLPGVCFQICQRVVSLCQALIQLKRLLCCRLRFRQIFLLVESAAVYQAPVNIGQLSIGKRVIRISGDRLIEILPGLLPIFGRAPGTVETSFEQ